MQRSPLPSLFLALAVLALPAAAQARPLDALRGARLQAATATVKLSETRCPPGTTTNCGKTQLDETFKAAKPKTTTVKGQPGFPAGVQIPGKGAGQCYTESPTTIQTGPDGSVQVLGGAAQLLPGEFAAQRIAIAATKRGVRVAWLEPVAPAIDCDYFQEPDTLLALPATQPVPSALVSPTISARMLKRSRFSITVAGSQDWTDTAADGSAITGRADWKLRLDYVGKGRSASRATAR
jgi:hypothetical protein